MHSALIETLQAKAAERAVERVVTNARFWRDRARWRRLCETMAFHKQPHPRHLCAASRAYYRDPRVVLPAPPAATADVSVGMLLDQKTRDLLANSWIKRWDC